MEAYAGKAEGRTSARFSALDVTSGLPDDDRQEDQHARALVERQRQGRARAAEAALNQHPEARAKVMRDQTALARFCARFSVEPCDVCPHRDEAFPAGARCPWCRAGHGAFRPVHVEDPVEVLRSPRDSLAEVRARESAILPSSEEALP